MLIQKLKRAIEIFICIFVMFTYIANAENLIASEEFFEMVTTIVNESAEINEPFYDEENSPNIMVSFIKGDVNGNGRVTSEDSTVFARWLIASEEVRNTTLSNFRILAADVNSDGKVNVADLILLSQLLVGIDMDFSLTFNGNGGIPAQQIKIVKRQAGVTARVGTLPTQPYRIGFRFIGWFDTRNQTGGTQITTNTTVTKNTTFWARWIPDVSISNPDNNSTVSGESDLYVTWSANSNATFDITLQNITTNTRVINENNGRRLFYNIRNEYLVPGNRYRFTVTATVDGAANSTSITFTVGNDTPYFRLGFTEWRVNNNRTRLLTYAVHPVREGRRVELNYAPEGRANLATIARRFSQRPMFMINGGWFTLGNPESRGYGWFYCSVNGFYENEKVDDGSIDYKSLIYFKDGRTAMIVETVALQNGRITLPSGAVLNEEYIRSNVLFIVTGDLEIQEDNRVQRSTIGVRPDGTLIFMMADSPTAGERYGVTIAEGEQYLRDMGATSIIRMDGGDSSQVFYNGTHYGGARGVGTVIAIW